VLVVLIFFMGGSSTDTLEVETPAGEDDEEEEEVRDGVATKGVPAGEVPAAGTAAAEGGTVVA